MINKYGNIELRLKKLEEMKPIIELSDDGHENNIYNSVNLITENWIDSTKTDLQKISIKDNIVKAK